MIRGLAYGHAGLSPRWN